MCPTQTGKKARGSIFREGAFPFARELKRRLENSRKMNTNHLYRRIRSGFKMLWVNSSQTVSGTALRRSRPVAAELRGCPVRRCCRRA